MWSVQTDANSSSANLSIDAIQKGRRKGGDVAKEIRFRMVHRHNRGLDVLSP